MLIFEYQNSIDRLSLYLYNCIQYKAVSTPSEQVLSDSSGVPQRSVIGPLLCNIYSSKLINLDLERDSIGINTQKLLYILLGISGNIAKMNALSTRLKNQSYSQIKSKIFASS